MPTVIDMSISDLSLASFGGGGGSAALAAAASQIASGAGRAAGGGSAVPAVDPVVAEELELSVLQKALTAESRLVNLLA